MKGIWSVLLTVAALSIFIAGAASGEGLSTSTKMQSPVSHPANPRVMAKKGAEDAICFRPIGFFHAPYNQRGSTPHQGALSPETRATITVEPAYRNALQGLDRFQYIIVLYYFDRITNWSDTVKPPWASRRFGLFSTRTPRRPNPIGMTVVRIESLDMEKGILHVSGVDAFDNTPVLDIKPYLPALDCVATETQARHIPGNLRRAP